MTRSKRTPDQQPDPNPNGAPVPAAGQKASAPYPAFLARHIIPPSLQPYESQAEFDALYQGLRDELSPETTHEEMCVETIATSQWRLRRFRRAHDAVLELEGFTATSLVAATGYLDCEAHLERQIVHTYTMLQAMQRRRRRAESETVTAASLGEPTAR